MDVASLIVFATALSVAAAVPGPGIAAIVARVLGRGAAGALIFALGIGLGDLVWLSFAAGGLSVLAQTFHELFLAVKWAGIVYLLHLARKIWSAPTRPVEMDQPSKGESSWTSLLAGLAVTMGNPKVMVFYLALLPTLVDLKTIGWFGLLEMMAVVALVLTLVFSAYIVLAARARRVLASPRRLRAVNRGSALAMCGAAGWVATR